MKYLEIIFCNCGSPDMRKHSYNCMKAQCDRVGRQLDPSMEHRVLQKDLIQFELHPDLITKIQWIQKTSQESDAPRAAN